MKRKREPTGHYLGPGYTMPVAVCPNCGYRPDRASMLDGHRRPRPGNFCICIKCGEVNIFAEDLSMRRPTAGETFKLVASDLWPTIQATQQFIKESRAAEKS